jgi:hypothetical protein
MCTAVTWIAICLRFGPVGDQLEVGWIGTGNHEIRTELPRAWRGCCALRSGALCARSNEPAVLGKSALADVRLERAHVRGAIIRHGVSHGDTSVDGWLKSAWHCDKRRALIPAQPA